MSMQFSRRDLVRGILGGAASLALTPMSLAQLGPPPGMIALRFNENPYGPSPGALKAAARAAALGAYYADDMYAPLLQTIADRNNVALENMVLSSGSNEGLQAAFVAWGGKGRIVLPSLTYTAHVHYARRMGVDVVPVPLKDDLAIDLDAMAAAVNDDVSLVYICNPNNPTGHTLDGDALRDFCRSVGRRAVVMIDEAYNDMAGMRVGYGIGRPDIAKTIADHVMAWPNGVGLAAAKACYGDDEFIKFSRSKIFEGRDMVVDTFRRNGIEPLPSQANFVFANIGRNGSEFQRQMAERKILIRGRYGQYPDYIRVSMGKIEDVKTFQAVFTDVFRGRPG
jgi:histidinol-phosphate aminotransferase